MTPARPTRARPASKRRRVRSSARAAADPVAYSIAVQKSVALPTTIADIRKIARTTLAAEKVAAAQISVALVDHPTMHRLNKRHLDHDESTDVLSFLFDEGAPPSRKRGGARAVSSRGAGKKLDGEIILCADMAHDAAPRFGWSPREELALYLVHGLLHLCGYDDLTAGERRVMRRRETEVLALLGIVRQAERKP